VLYISVLRLSVLWTVTNLLVSLANKTGTEALFMILGKSFTYNKNNRWPRTGPCGSSWWISDHLEVIKLWDLVLF